MQYLHKSMEDEVYFHLQINSKDFCKMVVSLWEYVARQAQSNKNNQFTISLQYVKENMEREVVFLPADKFWRFFQIDIIILGVCDQVCRNYLK